MSREYRYIRFFQDIRIDDVPSVGGKNASLGEMYRELTASGVRVPNGFAVTAQAYWYVLEQAGIRGALRNALEGLRPDDVDDLAKRGRRARELIYSAPLPADLQSEILDAYRRLQREYGPALSVAVRSSATAEDLPDASFAGQHETYLNIEGDEHLLDACRRCFASLFTDRAIHYRIDEGFDHFKVALSIGVMKMVRSDLAASGVIFTLDTESGFRDVVFITGAYGLGENVVQGAVDPDEFYVFKPTFEAGHRSGAAASPGQQEDQDDLRRRRRPRDHAQRAHARTPSASASASATRRCSTLADYAIKVEKHYSAQGRQAPADGHGMGQGRRRRRALHRPGAPGNGRFPAARQRPGDLPAASAGRAAGCRQRRSGRRSRAGPCASSPTSRTWPSSGRARCWSPTPRRPTGSRS